MSHTDDVSDPRPGIRAVVLTGFLTGDACGLVYALFTGHLFEFSWLDFYAVAAMAGIVIGVGIVGMMAGTAVGLSARLVLAALQMSKSWWLPVLLSALTSASLGVCIAAFLVGALFETR